MLPNTPKSTEELIQELDKVKEWIEKEWWKSLLTTWGQNYILSSSWLSSLEFQELRVDVKTRIRRILLHSLWTMLHKAPHMKKMANKKSNQERNELMLFMIYFIQILPLYIGIFLNLYFNDSSPESELSRLNINTSLEVIKTSEQHITDLQAQFSETINNSWWEHKIDDYCNYVHVQIIQHIEAIRNEVLKVA